MGEFLQHLTALSLGGGLVILVLMLAARLTGSRYAARWRCWVWLLLCLRLAVPLPLLPQASERAAPIQLPTVEDRVVLQPAQPPAVSASEPGPEEPIILISGCAARIALTNGSRRAGYSGPHCSLPMAMNFRSNDSG